MIFLHIYKCDVSSSPCLVGKFPITDGVMCGLVQIYSNIVIKEKHTVSLYHHMLNKLYDLWLFSKEIFFTTIMKEEYSKSAWEGHVRSG